MFERLLRLLLRAGWAPVSVLIFHAVIAKTSLRQSLDFSMHFLGGAAMAYFFWCALELFASWIGMLTSPGRYLFSFSLVCFVGLFWEFAEALLGTFLHTHVQQNLHETMSDLLADATGAFSALLLMFLFRFFILRAK